MDGFGQLRRGVAVHGFRRREGYEAGPDPVRPLGGQAGGADEIPGTGNYQQMPEGAFVGVQRTGRQG